MASDAATAEKIKLPHFYSMMAPMPIYLKLFYLPFPFSSSSPFPFLAFTVKLPRDVLTL